MEENLLTNSADIVKQVQHQTKAQEDQAKATEEQTKTSKHWLSLQKMQLQKPADP